ncbi:MAG: hypothetical protein EA380_09790 [Phycisphaeraceae bacterium]|nr:MAG: hypothetical protein EA380_09790 [Phycisphaeraceae bacterium]
MIRSDSPRIAAGALLIVALLVLPACQSWGGGRSSGVTLTAGDNSAQLQPVFTTRVYTKIDPNTVHLYLTDIDDLATATSSGVGLTGNVLHIHMFIRPRAGRTPIAFTASNATITHVVIAEGAYGIYSGGGFFLPSGAPGRATFAGRIRDATLRPIGATSGFADLLGWTTLSGNIAARQDDHRADQISAWLDALWQSQRLVRLDTPTSPGDQPDSATP